MTDKEFKRLSKYDLIMIIYELKRRESELEAELLKLKESAQSNVATQADLVMHAESAAKPNRILETAQQTAGTVLRRIKQRTKKSKNNVRL